MYCPNCGEENVDEAKFCKGCGKPMQGTPPTEEEYERESYRTSESLGPPPEIPNYLAQAILVTIFCCLPFGIVSIVYAAQVNGKLAVGDINGARDASKNAKMWAWIAFGIGIVLGLPVWIAVLVGVYGILGPVGLILIVLVALVALAIALYLSNSAKKQRL